MNRRATVLGMLSLLLSSSVVFADEPTVKTISADVLRDKIRGGLLGQILGNLNGLPHENEYIREPGNVTQYTPSLPDGARTDDDTDFEWVYVIAMQDENKVFLSQKRIAELWKNRINRGIYCSNLYARRLMDLGIEPPLTGSLTLNPWAEFNISGQFLCETFGLIAPGMPQTASRIGLNYTRVAIDHEPAQTTQLFCSMIASAFFTSDIDTLIDLAVDSLDKESVQRQIITDVRRWHGQYPKDWRETRRLLKEKYSQVDGGRRDRNGYELTTGSTIGALLYGNGDLAETLRAAFNFGWDADNTAATAGAVVGVVRGYRSLLAHDWQIVDRYRNTTRDAMPMDETITSFADRLIDLAEKTITERGGERTIRSGRPVYRVVIEKPANVYPMSEMGESRRDLRERLRDQVYSGIVAGQSPEQRARAAYLAICLDMSAELAEVHPDEWRAAVAALNGYQKLLTYLFSDDPNSETHLRFKQRALAAGLNATKK